MWEIQVWSLGQKDPLEKGMATHSSILGNFHGQRSLVGCSPWCCQESDTTEWLTLRIYVYAFKCYVYVKDKYKNTCKDIFCVCICIYIYISVQFNRCLVRLFAIPWTAACQASLSITNSQSLLILMSIESVIPSNHLILCLSIYRQYIYMVNKHK